VIKDHSKVMQFKSQLSPAHHFDSLFEHMDDIYFFVKDEHYKLIMCNDPLLRLFNLKHRHEIIGKSEYDAFPKTIADAIHEDDQTVIEQEQPLLNRMELIADENQVVKWVLTTKLPLYKKDSSIAGLMGFTRVIERADMIPDTYQMHAKALEHIKNHYNEDIKVQDLAKMCYMSVSHFRKTFKEKFKMSPQQFIIRLRIQIACKLLAHQEADITRIAHECGFCDQSYFTKQFRLNLGVTPKKYKDQLQPSS